MTLEELKVYQRAMELGEHVWTAAQGWEHFAKDTVGKQLVRAADSVAANLAEGYGRYHYNENRHFGYYSRGSLFETRTWLTKAANRGLISREAYDSLLRDIDATGRMLNAYINSIGSGSQTVREDISEYCPHSLPNDQ
jgi:four helix bundle protein